uniref:Aquaporin n=1 Tax=Alexandrium andersonii TaxID=327968 RepID=A0A7S2I0A6_9DINO|mmetsp:Transcript_76907/g.172069  ORF Transcript_76907/g.172069 Transcript_76907/m.172069 type:complete len:181 (+) Transcript_76907:74-616(+)
MTGGMQRGDSLKSQQSHQVSDIIVGHRQVLRDPQLREKLLAEFVGTFFLGLAVGISVVGGGAFVAIAIGLVLSVQIYTFGAVSGAFFNPAVTLAVLLCGRQKITGREVALYAVVQTLAGIVAGFCAFAASGSTFCFDYRSTRGWGASVELEARRGPTSWTSVRSRAGLLKREGLAATVQH